MFDRIDKNDLVMCFFPCVRFENQVMLWFRGDNYAQKDWTAEQNIQYDMKLMEELTHNYMLVNKLFLICMRKGLKLVMENPYSEEHFLRRYWCIKPNIIDYDRRKRGDYYKKPTQYWFLNCEPKNNFIFEITNHNAIGGTETVEYIHSEHYKKMGAKNQKVARSMIHPDYANRFIREYIIDQDTTECSNF